MNFLHIAQASLAEVGYCIHAALRLGYLSQESADDYEVEIKRVGAPLAGLIRSERTDVALKAGAVVIVFAVLLMRVW